MMSAPSRLFRCRRAYNGSSCGRIGRGGTVVAAAATRPTMMTRLSSLSLSSSSSPCCPALLLSTRSGSGRTSNFTARLSSTAAAAAAGTARRRRDPAALSTPFLGLRSLRTNRAWFPTAATTSTSWADYVLRRSLTTNSCSFSTAAGPQDDSVERDVLPFDVLIVGGGPAGLATAIKIKQLCQQRGSDLSVCVVDKGSEIGAHILSGNVFDPVAIDPLLPNWKQGMQELTGSVATPVTSDSFLVLPNDHSSFQLPNYLLPPQLHNDNNYVISLSQLCRYMAAEAEELGVEIYPGFAAAAPIVEDNTVKGIVTRDVGIAKDGSRKATFEPGVELRARHTVLAEGARGSCTEQLMEQFQLRQRNNSCPQAYGLGIKEVWQVPPETFRSGLVQHTLGWPLQDSVWSKTFGGSFLYHQDPDLVLIGMVVGLDYPNPYLNPYKEFQRFKTHPAVRSHLENGTCVSYGARVLNEGGYHSIPHLTMPGALLVGCAAGFLNAVKIKGTHTAIGSGVIAAQSIVEALVGSSTSSVAETGELPDGPLPELTSYGEAMNKSWIMEELYQVRNSHEAFSRWGVGAGLVYTGFTSFVSRGREPWTFKHTKLDCDTTGLANQYEEIKYQPADNKLTFDLLTNLQRSGTYHEDDQPSHLRIKPQLSYVPKSLSLPVHAGPEQRFCPAQVYEYVGDDDDKGKKELVINAQNCIHCKCCSIKMPREYIDWTVPEGGGGPQYQVM